MLFYINGDWMIFSYGGTYDSHRHHTIHVYINWSIDYENQNELLIKLSPT